MIACLVVFAYLMGVITLLVVDAGLTRKEALVLVPWPVLLPASLLVSRVRRRRSTCPLCHGWFGDRAHLANHVELSGHRRGSNR